MPDESSHPPTLRPYLRPGESPADREAGIDVAPPERWRSLEERERALHAFDQSQAFIGTQYGQDPAVAALKERKFQEALARGELPVAKLGRVAALAQEARERPTGREDLRQQAHQLVGGGQTAHTWSADPHLPQMETRAQRLRAAGAAQPEIEVFYEKMAQAASRRAGRTVSVQEIRSFVPSLSDQQLAFVKDEAPVSLALAGPGSGKSTTMRAKMLYDILVGGADPREYLVTSKTRSATSAFLEPFGADPSRGRRDISELVPGWTPEVREKQTRTLDSLAMGQLHTKSITSANGERLSPLEFLQSLGKNPADKELLKQEGLGYLAQGGYQPLYQKQGDFLDSDLEAARGTLEQFIERTMRHQGIAASAYNATELAHYVTDSKQDRLGRYQQRFARGTELFGQFEATGRRLSTTRIDPDLALFLSEKALNSLPRKEGQHPFRLPDEKSPRYDLSDASHMVGAALRLARRSGLSVSPRVGRVVGDEIQDADPNHIGMLKELARHARTGGPRMAFGGDMGQMVVQRNYPIDQMLTSAFRDIGIRSHTLTGNYRSGPYGVALTNAVNTLSVLRGRPQSPMQTSMFPLGTTDKPPTMQLGPTYRDVHTRMVLDWLADRGTSPGQIKAAMQRGEHPLAGLTGEQSPGRNPFVFQTSHVRESFTQTLSEMLSREMGGALTREFMARFVSRETPSAHNEGQMQALMISQIRGREASSAYLDVGRVGQWDAAGYADNLRIMLSRAREQNRMYASLESFPGGALHDMSPQTFGGEAVAPGFPVLLQVMSELGAHQQNIGAGQMPDDLQEALQARVPLTYAHQGGTGPVQNDALLKEYIDEVFSLNRSYQPEVGAGAGIHSLEEVGRETLYGEEDGGEGKTAGGSPEGFTVHSTFNALIGKNRNGVDHTKLQLVSSFMRTLLREGSGALDVFSDPQVRQMKPELLSSLLERPEGAGTLSRQLSPVGVARRSRPVELSPGDPRHAQMPEGLEELIPFFRQLFGKARTPQAEAFMGRLPPQEEFFGHTEGLGYGTKVLGPAGDLVSYKEYLPRALPEGDADRPGRAASGEDPGRIIYADEEPIYQLMARLLPHVGSDPSVAGLIGEGATGKQVMGMPLSGDLVHTLAQAAEHRARAPWAKPEYRSFLQEQAQALREGYGADVGDIRMDPTHLARLEEHGDPMQAEMVRRLLDNGQGGLHPVGETDQWGTTSVHPEVETRLRHLAYLPGKIARTLDTPEKASRFGIPLHAGRNAAAQTRLASFFALLDKPMEQGETGGILDPQALRHLGGEDSEVSQSLGSGMALSQYAKRLRDQLVHSAPGFLTSDKAQGVWDQYERVRGVQHAIASPRNQLRYAHTLRTLLRATTGEDVQADPKTDAVDPIRTFFGPRMNDSARGGRTLSTVVAMQHALEQATTHIEQTGSIKRSHVDNLLQAFGWSPDDKRFMALRALERSAQFRPTRDNPDPSLRLETLINQFSPGMRNDLQGQLTRTPLLPGRSYQFMGGEQGFGGMAPGQQGATSGLVGRLEPFNKGTPFGMSKNLAATRAAQMLTPQEYQQYKAVSDGSLDLQPLLQFVTQNASGEEQRFPVRADQLRMAPTSALPSLQQGGSSSLSTREGDHPVVMSPGDTQAGGTTAAAHRVIPLGSRARRMPVVPITHNVTLEHELGASKAAYQEHTAVQRTRVQAYQEAQKRTAAQRTPTGARSPARPSARTSPLPGSVGARMGKEQPRYSQSWAPLGRAHLLDARLQEQAHLKLGSWLSRLFGYAKKPWTPEEEAEIRAMEQAREAQANDEQPTDKRRAVHREVKAVLRQNPPPPRSVRPLPGPVSATFAPSSFQEGIQVPQQAQAMYHPSPPTAEQWQEQEEVQHTSRRGATTVHPPTAGGAASPPGSLEELGALLRTTGTQEVGGTTVHPPTAEQRQVLDMTSKHFLIEGGPGAGKTLTVGNKMADLVARREVLPQEMLAMSATRSGTAELEGQLTRLGGLLGQIPGVGQDDRYLPPRASTFHGAAYRTLFGQMFPTGPGSQGEFSPLLQAMGLGQYGRRILSDVSKEDIDWMTPSEKQGLDLSAESQSAFFRRAVEPYLTAASRSGADPTARKMASEKGMEGALKAIGGLKHGDLADYQAAQALGAQHAQQGVVSHEALLHLYEEQQRREGTPDFDDVINFAGHALQGVQRGQLPAAHLPEFLQQARLFTVDEGQDLFPAQARLLEGMMGFARGEGRDPRLLVGFDRGQSLFGNLGGVSDVVGAYSQIAGEALSPVQLHGNLRSDRADVALNNAILTLPEMAGVEGKSPLQFPLSPNRGSDPRFLLASNQSSLYQQAFRSMLGTAGVSFDTLRQNVSAGAHPFEGVDFSAPGHVLPSQVPMIVSTNNQRRLFEHESGAVLAHELGLSHQQAGQVLRQIYRRNAPSGGMRQAEIDAAHKQFWGMKVAGARSKQFAFPHVDATRVGGWLKKNQGVSYLKNLFTGLSRVSRGGRNTILATERPYSPQFLQKRINGGQLGTDPTGVPTLDGQKLYLSKQNEFEQYGGGPVPALFGRILPARDQQLSAFGAGIPSTGARGPTPALPSPTSPLPPVGPLPTTPSTSPLPPAGPTLGTASPTGQISQGGAIRAGFTAFTQGMGTGLQANASAKRDEYRQRIEAVIAGSALHVGDAAKLASLQQSYVRLGGTPFWGGGGGTPVPTPATGTGGVVGAVGGPPLPLTGEALVAAEQHAPQLLTDLVEQMSAIHKQQGGIVGFGSPTAKRLSEHATAAWEAFQKQPGEPTARAAARTHLLLRSYHQQVGLTPPEWPGGGASSPLLPYLHAYSAAMPNRDINDVIGPLPPLGADVPPGKGGGSLSAGGTSPSSVLPAPQGASGLQTNQGSSVLLGPGLTRVHANTPRPGGSAPGASPPPLAAASPSPVAPSSIASSPVPAGGRAAHTPSSSPSTLMVQAQQMTVNTGPQPTINVTAQGSTTLVPPTSGPSGGSAPQAAGGTPGGGGGGAPPGFPGGFRYSPWTRGMTWGPGAGGGGAPPPAVSPPTPTMPVVGGGGGGGTGGGTPGGGGSGEESDSGGGRRRGGSFNNITGSMGHTLTRIGGEMQFISKLFEQITNQAIDQGSAYRRASIPVQGGGSGTEGFYDFTNPQSGISQLQQQSLPMYSKVQLAQQIRSVSAASGNQALNPLGATQSLLSLAAVSGVAPQELIAPTTAIAGTLGQANQTDSIAAQLGGGLTSLYGTNLSAENVVPTLQTVQQVLPTVQGVSLGGDSQVSSVLSILQGALKGGMTPGNLGDVGSVIGSLSQMGTTPDLQQQYVLSRLFGGQHMTAGVQLAEYGQQQVSEREQLATLSLQQNIGGGLSLPQLQINVAQAEIQMEKANLDMSSLQYSHDVASFQEQQYVQTQQLGPIGADVSRNSYFDFMRKQMQAGYNPLSAETGTTFKSSPTFGLQNAEFYAGIEHQRSMMVLGRSPLLRDAAFQEQMKYLNEQEAFYHQQLELQNQQRQFEKDWTQKLLDQQGVLIDLQKKRYGLDVQMNAYQQKLLRLQEQFLPQQAAALSALIGAQGQLLRGQGPVNGQNVTPEQILRQLVAVKDPNEVKQLIQAMRIPLDQQNTLLHLVEGIQKAGGFDKLKASQNPDDKKLLAQAQQMIKQGAFADQTSGAAIADAFLNFAGKGQGWDQFVGKFEEANATWKQIGTQFSSLNATMKDIATKLAIAGPAATAAGTGLNILGLGQGLGSVVGGWLGGAGGAAGTAAGAVAGGTVGLLGTAAIGAGLLGWGTYDRQSANDPLSWQNITGDFLGPFKVGQAAHGLTDDVTRSVHGDWGWISNTPQQDKAIGNFFTQTVPGWWHGVTGSGDPKQIAAAKASALTAPKVSDGFLSSQQQKQITDAATSFFTKTLPQWWSHNIAGPFNTWIGGLPKWWSQNIAGPFNGWLAGLPKWWSQNIAGPFNGWVGGLPKWWSQNIGGPFNSWIGGLPKWFAQNIAGPFNTGIVQPALTFFQKTLPDNWNTFFTKTLPGLWSKDVTTPISTFFSKTMPDLFTKTITDLFKGGSSGGQSPGGGGNLFSTMFGWIFGGQNTPHGGGGPPVPGVASATHQGFVTPQVTTEFGEMRPSGPHQGVDFAIPQGTPTKEFIGGRVLASSFQPWGGEVDVQIPGGMIERYLHLSALAVKPGQVVPRGSFLGLSGGGTPASGLGTWSTGPHSHVQIDHGNMLAASNPWPYWAAAGATDISAFYGGGQPSSSSSSSSVPNAHHGGGGFPHGPHLASSSSHLHHLAQGGIALSHIRTELGEQGPEAVVPLSKLSEVLKSVQQHTGAPSSSSGSGGSRNITIDKLIGTVHLTVGGGGSGSAGGGGMTDAEKDELLSELLDLLSQAARHLTDQVR